MASELLINILQNGKVQPIAEDLHAMYSFAGKLDAVCAEAGVSPLSSFFDVTDDNADLDELDLLIDNGAHLATQGTWFNPTPLLDTLAALRAELTEKPRRFGLLSNKYETIMNELDRALAAAEYAKSRGAQLHFLVV